MIDTSCFDDIIGLSNTDCTCYDPKPAGYDTSDSGLFVDDLLSLQAIKDDCTNGNKWEILADARSEAYLEFYTDLLNAIRRNQRRRYNDYKGDIGNNSAGSFLTNFDDYAGMKFWLNDIRGGVMTIKEISLWINQTGNTTVSIYEQIGDIYTKLGDYVVATTANTLSKLTLSTPLEIDLFSDQCEYKKIYAVYSTSGLQMRNNSIHCGCGGKKNTVCDPPCYGWDINQKRRWTEFVMATGVTGDDLADIDDWSANSQLAYGLRLNVKFDCRILDGICNILEDENHSMYMDIAKAIQYLAAKKAWEKVIHSGKVNRYTLMELQAVYGQRNHTQKEYLERIEVLSKELLPEMLSSDCYECKSPIAKRKMIK